MNTQYAESVRRTRGQILGVSNESVLMRTLAAKSNAGRRLGLRDRRDRRSWNDQRRFSTAA